MALAHKDLAHRAVPVHFTDIPQIVDGKQKTVPVIVDGSTVVGDSWKIANYLEETCPDRPSFIASQRRKPLRYLYKVGRRTYSTGTSSGYCCLRPGNYGLFPVHDVLNQPMDVPLPMGNSWLAQCSIQCAGDRFE